MTNAAPSAVHSPTGYRTACTGSLYSAKLAASSAENSTNTAMVRICSRKYAKNSFIFYSTI